MTRVAVIGGGWAGLAAAVRATACGARVSLFEAAPALGGRARTVSLRIGSHALDLDNGQHLMVGAYATSLELFRQVGAPLPTREALHLRGVDGLDLRCPRLPAPWHLLVALSRARGLSWPERAAIVRAMAGLRLKRWRLPPGWTLSQWLHEARQPPSLVRRWWAPLCIATLNTPIDQACANTFAAVLRDMLGASAAASDTLTPEGTLGAQFPEPAARWLQAHGAEIRCRERVRALIHDGSAWRVQGTGEPLRADRIVIATPEAVTGALLESTGHTDVRDLAARLQRQAHEPIATVWLAWPRGSVSLPPWSMLEEDALRESWGQWIFDRGPQADLHLAAVVISACGELRDREGRPPSLDDIARATGAQVARQCRVALPVHARTVIDRRATFRCTPDRPRALADAGHGLWLAGDWLEAEYPACLEAAVRSGWRAGEGAARSGS